jgi:RHS repeat-associated protein
VPPIALPKGGGAVRGIGEKFTANPLTGTGSLNVPIYTSPGRSGFGPQLSLSYDSGSGNGPFGFGWMLSLPSIARSTDRGLPRYRDVDESDVFVLSGAEDLVPVLTPDGEFDSANRTVDGIGYTVRRYRPRIEAPFARIERWSRATDPGDTFWRSISRDNITTWYGRTAESRIADPADPVRIFRWLICESHDDKGNVVSYGYKHENSDGVLASRSHESHRTDPFRSANCYLKRVRYGNRAPYLPQLSETAPWPTPPGASDPDAAPHWLFEIVFDYGEHAADDPARAEVDSWTLRNDPFSSYRAAFEVRTYRLCQRALMFHHFPDEPGVGANCLVRSTDFSYSYEEGEPDPRDPIFSFLLSATQCGYRRGPSGYVSRALPPLEFEYTDAVIDQEIHEIDAESLENLPDGLDSARYHWVDLHADGLAGILTEQGGGWFFKRNLSLVGPEPSSGLAPRFSGLEQIRERPSTGEAAGARPLLLDLAGDGQVELVDLDGPVRGFFERTADERWEPFAPFASVPALDWADPNLRFVDLTGDGHADVLITQDEVFTWHPSLGEAGFGPAETIRKALDENTGPRLVFADGTQSIYLADFSGDGLTDFARISNGEVCYWPNLGYGRFGAKVTMDGAPWFEGRDLFDQRRIRLADVDGSGLTDIIYLAHDGVDIYFNQSGNSWSKPQRLLCFPAVDDAGSVQVADLLGNGTACLVWSSSLPGHARRPMRYVDLMGGQKPHLLISVHNNLGAETRVQYASSTRFYVQDWREGRPWITRLPFPVQVVARVDTHDYVSRSHFVNTYTYHHGYFDGPEREFRGFGMVEQRDAEEFGGFTPGETLGPGGDADIASHVPPVLTRTWFHTGVYLGRDRVSRFFGGLLDQDDRGEYYREPDATDGQAQALLLDDTVLPPALSVEEEREACRALKGSMLRQEVFALDGTGTEDYPDGHPYTVSEQNFTVERLQPIGRNRHAVFLIHAREALSYHYERSPDDPRVSHALTLEVDPFGNVERSLSIAYPRRAVAARLPEQARVHLTLTVNRFVNHANEDDWHRIGVPIEARTFEVVKPPEPFVTTTSVQRLGFDAMRALMATLFPLTEADPPTATSWPVGKWDWRTNPANAPGETRLRPIEHVRTIYRRDDLSAPLAPGDVQSLALVLDSYKLALMPDVISSVYERRLGGGSPELLLPEPASVLGGTGADQGGYVDLAGDGRWWKPSGRTFYSTEADVANPAATAAEELEQARASFFMPRKFADPFGHTATVDYDPYALLPVRTEDALHNVIAAVNDYRVLQPTRATDPNGNRSEVAYDALGLVAGTAVIGKDGEGDSLAGFDSDPDQIVIDQFHDVDDPHDAAPSLLGSATTRIVYDIGRFRRTYQAQPEQPDSWLPAYAATLARETHASDPVPDGGLKIQIAFSYSDGFGREVQKKIQAEPGPVVDAGPAVSPRWTVSGWTIFNNKGKPVRQYEPFFSQLPARRHQFEFGVTFGLSPVFFYDPMERLVATLHPNHSWQKVVFDPWRQTTYDPNDTVLNADGSPDPRDDDSVKAFFSKLPDAAYLPSWYQQRIALPAGDPERAASEQTAIHRQTPTVAHLDTLGRVFFSIAHNRFERDGEIVEEHYPTRLELDIEGNHRQVRDAVEQNDALGRVIMRYDYDLLGGRLHQASMEAGERWSLHDVSGTPIRAWDSRGHNFTSSYDPLRRQIGRIVRGTNPNRSDPRTLDRDVLFEKTEYGEGQPDESALNLRTRVFRKYDGAGFVTSGYDFKGNPVSSARTLLEDYRAIADWNGAPAPGETLLSLTTFDALNRPIALATHDHNVIRPAYNEANLLERLDVNVMGDEAGGEPVWTPFVLDIDYNAKGQRERIEYANGAATEYAYDPLTFRVARLLTRRGGTALQDLRYTHDPSGNVTSIADEAQQTVYFGNAVVDANAAFVVDAMYRLIAATGREHIGQLSHPETTWDDEARTDRPHPGDGQAMRRYTERYDHDAVGNLLGIVHEAGNGSWTRTYEYDEPSLIDANDRNNRLSRTIVGSFVEPYVHDAHGNMTGMPHVAGLLWDFANRLWSADLGGGGRAYYVYDAAGQRARKVWEKSPGLIEDRVYDGACEVFRRLDGTGAIVLERHTLHVNDDKQRIALVEVRTQGSDGSPARVVRVQCGNHLGSAALELDETGQTISYEEYFPYGGTSYQAVRTDIPVSLKRYRYTGKERDEDTGLYYFGARYYAPWIGRWTSCDPKGLAAGVHLYAYVRGNPIRFADPDGRDVPLYAGFGEGPLEDPNARLKMHHSGNYYLAEGYTPDVRNPVERAIINTELTGDPKFVEEVEKQFPASTSDLQKRLALQNAARHAGIDIREDVAWQLIVQFSIAQIGVLGVPLRGVTIRTSPTTVVKDGQVQLSGGTGRRTGRAAKAPSGPEPASPAKAATAPEVTEPHALVNGKKVAFDAPRTVYYGTNELKPEEVLAKGLPARGTNRDLLNHIQQGENSAFRGSTKVPSDPVNQGGAAEWAQEGGWVYKITTRALDANRALQGRVRGPGGQYGGNPAQGENEMVIEARQLPEHVEAYGQVVTDSKGRLVVKQWIENPNYKAPE